MRITTKRQVTIPEDVRDELGFFPPTEVEFGVVGDHALIRKLALTGGPGERGRRALEALRGTSDAGLSTDEIMAMTRCESDGPEGKDEVRLA